MKKAGERGRKPAFPQTVKVWYVMPRDVKRRSDCRPQSAKCNRMQANASEKESPGQNRMGRKARPHDQPKNHSDSIPSLPSAQGASSRQRINLRPRRLKASPRPTRTSTARNEYAICVVTSEPNGQNIRVSYRLSINRLRPPTIWPPTIWSAASWAKVSVRKW